MHLLFKRTDELISKIDQFINMTREASLHFQKALFVFFNKQLDDFERMFAIISKTESEADNLRKDIEAKLYLQTLIPEARGDVLNILETMDKIINSTKSVIKAFSIEQPEIPEEIRQGMIELAAAVDKSVEALVAVVRTYFDNARNVRHSLHLVKFYEREADEISDKTKRQIFSLQIPLAEKLQLKHFVSGIDNLADEALDVADVVSIAAAKLIV